MKKKGKYCDEELWVGGFFELFLVFQNGKKHQILKAMKSLEKYPNVNAYFSQCKYIPKESMRFSPKISDVKDKTFYGVISFPNNDKLPFRTISYKIKYKIAHVYFFALQIGMGALDKQSKYKVDIYPFDSNIEHKWVMELSEFFYDIAKNIFINVRFNSGGVGFIAGFEEEIDGLTISKVPKERWSGYIVNYKNKLYWFPPNMLSGPIR